MGVGEPAPLQQDDLPQAPPRSDGGGGLCGSADQRETGGGTSADPADPSHPASHLFHRYWILLQIRPVLQILRNHWLYQLFIWTWLLQVIWAQASPLAPETLGLRCQASPPPWSPSCSLRSLLQWLRPWLALGGAPAFLL